MDCAGGVPGLPDEPEGRDLPRLIPLGSFAAGRENEFAIDLDAPEEAALRCAMDGVTVTPPRLVRGRNVLTIRVAPLRDGTVLYGELWVDAPVSRQIYVTGKALTGAPERRLAPAPQPEPDDAPDVPRMRRGQRLPLPGAPLRVLWHDRGRREGIELDAYVFLLGEGDRVRDDRGLIFWGHERSARGEVAVGSEDGRPVVSVDPARLETWAAKVAVCYSIYGEEPALNFSLVAAPEVRVFCGEEELCRFALDGLRAERTVVALELYRYKGEWRVNFVGSGYRSDLRRLCEGFGVHVD